MDKSGSQLDDPYLQAGTGFAASPRRDMREGSDGSVHSKTEEVPIKRVSRGLRMSQWLWATVDDLAEMKGVSVNALIEEWVAERVTSVLDAA